MSVGMPAHLKLLEFGQAVLDAFNEDGSLEGMVYHVGSSVRGKKWRDVDVRLILTDDEYSRMGFGHPDAAHSSPRWVAMVKAFAALGREMTGLPIDFQIQQQTFANKLFSRKAGHGRSALFMTRDNGPRGFK